VSAIAQAARERFGNLGPGAVTPDVWSLQHPIAYSLLWIAVMLAVFVPLSVWQYRRAASRTP
jgi:hypothetical protein